MKLRLILAMLIAAGSSTDIAAATPSGELLAHVDELHSSCPIDFRDGWVVQTFHVNNESTTVTITVNIDSVQFSDMKENLDSLHKKWLGALSGYGENWIRLVDLTCRSGLPLIIDMIPLDGSDTLSLTFSPSELSAALGK